MSFSLMSKTQGLSSPQVLFLSPAHLLCRNVQSLKICVLPISACGSLFTVSGWAEDHLLLSHSFLHCPPGLWPLLPSTPQVSGLLPVLPGSRPCLPILSLLSPPSGEHGKHAPLSWAGDRLHPFPTGTWFNTQTWSLRYSSNLHAQKTLCFRGRARMRAVLWLRSGVWVELRI